MSPAKPRSRQVETEPAGEPHGRGIRTPHPRQDRLFASMRMPFQLSTANSARCRDDGDGITYPRPPCVGEVGIELAALGFDVDLVDLGSVFPEQLADGGGAATQSANRDASETARERGAFGPVAAARLEALAGAGSAQLADRRTARRGRGGAGGSVRLGPAPPGRFAIPSAGVRPARLRRSADAAPRRAAVRAAASTADAGRAEHRRVKATACGPASPPAAGAAARRSRGPGCAACRFCGSGARCRGGPRAPRAVRRVRARRCRLGRARIARPSACPCAWRPCRG